MASQKAEWLGASLNAKELDEKGFQWKDMGVLAYIGSKNALFQSDVGGDWSGKAAWLVWRGAYLTKSVSIKNKVSNIPLSFYSLKRREHMVLWSSPAIAEIPVYDVCCGYLIDLELTLIYAGVDTHVLVPELAVWARHFEILAGVRRSHFAFDIVAGFGICIARRFGYLAFLNSYFCTPYCGLLWHLADFPTWPIFIIFPFFFILTVDIESALWSNKAVWRIQHAINRLRHTAYVRRYRLDIDFDRLQ